MNRTFCCHHCGNIATVNHRLKFEQKYCSEKECQQARRRNWKKRQYAESAVYREKSKDNQKAWRKARPANQYQRLYRERHPEYVNRNRELQKGRNEMRVSLLVSTLIKPSSLILQPRECGGYLLSMVKKDLIVNRNALAIQSPDI